MNCTISPVAVGEYRKGKRSDCAVRALCNVSLADYEECEQVFIDNGRAINKGSSPDAIVGAYHAFGLRDAKIYGDSIGAKQFKRAMHMYGLLPWCNKGMTLKTFIANNPKGRFVVIYSRHAVAVINGQLVDTFASNQNKRVVAVFSKF